MLGSAGSRVSKSLHTDERRWKRLGMGAMAVLLSLAVTATAELTVRADELQLAPAFTLPNLDGVDVSLEEHYGSVIILDFWASWCHVCIRTFPEIHALQQAYAEDDVILLAVSLDKTAEEAREYLVQNELPTDNVLWGSLDEARAVRDLYGISSVVHTFVIDRTGYIRFSGHPDRLTAEVLEPWL